MNKKDIEKAAVQYAEYVVSTVSQVDNNGKVQYYFSGSLAMNLISSAKIINLQSIDTNGDVITKSENILVSQTAKESFKKSIRQLSSDIDLVTINENVFNNGVNRKLCKDIVLKECDLAIDLCPNWGNTKVNGTFFDILSDEREIKQHDVAELTLDNGSKILICDPINLLMHKFNEFFVLETIRRKRSKTNNEKIEKDVLDFSGLFNGLNKLKLIPCDIKNYLIKFFEQFPDRRMETFLMQDEKDFLESLYKLISNNIEEENKEQFISFIKGINEYNLEHMNPCSI